MEPSLDNSGPQKTLGRPLHPRHDEVRLLRRRKTARAVLGKTRKRTAVRRARYRFAQREGKVRVRRSRALDLAQRPPRRRDVHVLQRLVRRRGSVGADGEVGAGVDKFAVGEGALVAVFAEELRPGFEEDGVGVGRLHGGGDAGGGEAGAVAGAGQLEVLDSVAVAGGAEVRESVDGEFDRAVADGVEGALEACAVGFLHDGAEGVVGPGYWGGGLACCVGFEKGGGARVDDAVAHELDARDPEVGRGGGVELLAELDGFVDLGQVFCC